MADEMWQVFDVGSRIKQESYIGMLFRHTLPHLVSHYIYRWTLAVKGFKTAKRIPLDVFKKVKLDADRLRYHLHPSSLS